MSERAKKKLFNIIMIAAIAAVAIACVFIAGNIRGWFSPAKAVQSETVLSVDDGADIIAQSVSGSVNIERGGIAYMLSEGDALKDGDIVETLFGARAQIASGESVFTLSENSASSITALDGGRCITLERGEGFAEAKAPFKAEVSGESVSCESGVFGMSAQTGSASLYVYGGEVTVGGTTISAGEGASLLEAGVTKAELSVSALNDFEMEMVKRSGETLCFSAAQIDEVQAQREAEIQAAREAQLAADAHKSEQDKEIERQRQKNAENSKNAAQGDTENTDAETPRSESTDLICTIEIRCDTILDNMNDLADGKSEFVPENGCILAASSVAFSEGETVFDVLSRACDAAGIQLEYAWTPAYDSYYIEGINNLYEFDCGNESGWMYKVNGWFPNYGCSGCTLQNGDAITWCYTCKGLGADVGGSVNR